MNIILGIALLLFGLLLIWKAPGDGKLLGLASFGSGALMLATKQKAYVANPLA